MENISLKEAMQAGIIKIKPSPYPVHNAVIYVAIELKKKGFDVEIDCISYNTINNSIYIIFFPEKPKYNITFAFGYQKDTEGIVQLFVGRKDIFEIDIPKKEKHTLGLIHSILSKSEPTYTDSYAGWDEKAFDKWFVNGGYYKDYLRTTDGEVVRM